MHKPITWTIAGSDSSGGAGIQADLHAFQALGVHGCSVIAALTAQNSLQVSQVEFVSTSMVSAQIEALLRDMPPQAIKLGMLGSLTTLKAIIPVLQKISVPVVCDPVLFASAGDALYEGDIRDQLIQNLFPCVTLLTPNVPEAEWLLKRQLISNTDMVEAAHSLLAYGPKAILLKGGHARSQSTYAQDYFTDGKNSFWLNSKRLGTVHKHGSGCTLASAITAGLAQHYDIKDALVIAKAYVNQGLHLSQPIGQGPGPVAHHRWPTRADCLPWKTINSSDQEPAVFPPCINESFGFYPIVDSAAWVARCLAQGVKTLQIRIKETPEKQIYQELKTAIHLASQYQAQLFINDHWRIALDLGAYGVHLGQEDLTEANCEALLKAGLRLGVSAHSYSELARAHALRPSYIAIGPIYETTTKKLAYEPQGLAKLNAYRQLLDYPVVAIGGINWQRLPEVWQTKVNGVCVISAITQAEDPDNEIRRWLNFFTTTH